MLNSEAKPWPVSGLTMNIWAVALAVALFSFKWNVLGAHVQFP